MIPEHMASNLLEDQDLVEISPGAHNDIALYFHRWQIQSRALDVLGNAVSSATQLHLRQVTRSS